MDTLLVKLQEVLLRLATMDNLKEEFHSEEGIHLEVGNLELKKGG